MKSKKDVLEIMNHYIEQSEESTTTIHANIYLLKAIAEGIRFQVERGL